MELLVALGIGALVVSVILLAHRALSQNTSRQSGRIHERALMAQTFRAFQDELEQLFAAAGDRDCAIELENSPTSLVQLAFCRWERGAGMDWPATNRVEHVRFLYADLDGNKQLVLQRNPIAGPGVEMPAQTNWPGKTWPQLTIHLHDGQQWRTNWIGDDKARPVAARIQLLGSNNLPVQEHIVVIPSGLSATSRIARTGPVGVSL